MRIKGSRPAQHPLFLRTHVLEFELPFGMSQHHLPRAEFVREREVAGPQAVVRERERVLIGPAGHAIVKHFRGGISQS